MGEGPHCFVCWSVLEVGPFNLSTRRGPYWRGLLRILWKLWRRFVDSSTYNPAPASLLIKLYWLRGSYFNLHLSFGVKTKRQEPMSVIRNNRLNIWTTHNAHSRALLRTQHSRASSGVSCSAVLRAHGLFHLCPKYFVVHLSDFSGHISSMQRQNSHCVSE